MTKREITKNWDDKDKEKPCVCTSVFIYVDFGGRGKNFGAVGSL